MHASVRRAVMELGARGRHVGMDCVSVPKTNVMEGGRTVGVRERSCELDFRKVRVGKASRSRGCSNWFLEVEISVFLSVNFPR